MCSEFLIKSDKNQKELILENLEINEIPGKSVTFFTIG